MPISEVYNQDCIMGMKNYPDKYFDLAIVDPPYFTGPEKRRYYGSEINKLNIRRKNYPISDNWHIPTKKYFRELIRVSKNQIIWGCNYFNYQFDSGRIIWDKVNQSSSFSDCEIAYCSFHDSVRLIRYMWNGMMQGKSLKEGHIMQGDKTKNEVRIHTTQKPILLYKWLIKTYAQPNDKILDTHMGSQSSRIAAFEMGFDYTGFEIDQTYFESGCKRFDLITSQQQLFI